MITIVVGNVLVPNYLVARCPLQFLPLLVDVPLFPHKVIVPVFDRAVLIQAPGVDGVIFWVVADIIDVVDGCVGVVEQGAHLHPFLIAFIAIIIHGTNAEELVVGALGVECPTVEILVVVEGLLFRPGSIALVRTDARVAYMREGVPNRTPFRLNLS